MRTILLGISILIASATFAQRECATAQYAEQRRSIDPRMTSRQNSIEEFISRAVNLKTEGEGASVIRIPVVFHILYKNEAQNISDAQVKSQIDALNRDFRKKNADTANLPERFRVLAADVEIEFVLATTDPSGKATTGIIRKQTTKNYWDSDDKIKFASQGGDNAWNSRFYLNIWVGSMLSVLGYATLPGESADIDGVVLNYKVCGTTNSAGAYNLGRTAVHEVGHWLGLKHIWGESYCGDDGVSDTPKQGNNTNGCPNGFRSSCNNGTMGDMYQNYMDYTNDACMGLFTKGQKQRMLSLFNTGGPRASFLESKGLNTPWNTDPEVVAAPLANAAIKFYPNPVANVLVLNFEESSWIGSTISIIGVDGIVVKKFTVTEQTQKVNLASLRSGLYFIEGANGGHKMHERLMKL